MITTLLIGLLTLALASLALLTVKYLGQHRQLKALSAELEQAAEKYEKLSGDLNQHIYEPLQRDMIDSLTGLPDRKTFEDRLLQAINNGNRLNTVFAVICIDIDELSAINKLGHDVGDRVLREFAVRVQSCLRQVDTLTRFTGGCFVILLPHLNRAETAVYVAQRIQDNLIQSFKIDAYEINVKATMGIAIYPIDAKEATGLLECAERALKQAKQAGKNKYQFFQTAIHDLGTKEISIATLVRSQEFLNKITIQYCPFFTADNQVIYVQATEHLQHPQLGLLPFDKISQIVENSGKTIEVKTWLLQQALKQIKMWAETGFAPKKLGIQVSLHQLENSHFIYMLIEMMRSYRDQVELVLEITDDIIHQNPASLEQIFTLLNKESIEVAVGVIALGHFAMQKINHIPLDYLLIDTKITAALIAENDKSEVLRKIIELAKMENITVMAEGIDTESQKKMISELGCELMKGKLYGYLMPTGTILEKQE